MSLTGAVVGAVDTGVGGAPVCCPPAFGVFGPQPARKADASVRPANVTAASDATLILVPAGRRSGWATAHNRPRAGVRTGPGRVPRPAGRLRSIPRTGPAQPRHRGPKASPGSGPALHAR